MDPITIATVGTALLGAYMGSQQQKAQMQARKEQALMNMYAPIFGQAPQALGAKQDFVTPAALQGALSGYQMGAQYEQNKKLNSALDKLNGQDTANPNASIPLFGQVNQNMATNDALQNYYAIQGLA